MAWTETQLVMSLDTCTCLFVHTCRPPEPGPTLHVSALKSHPELSIVVKGGEENI